MLFLNWNTVSEKFYLLFFLDFEFGVAVADLVILSMGIELYVLVFGESNPLVNLNKNLSGWL